MRTNRTGVLGRVIAAGLAGWLAIGPVVAEAAIDDSLASFFSSFNAQVAVTPPGVYESQTRGYLTGGVYGVRLPMQATQLLSLTPPRFGMGCNGFDATFGGLSYVSLDRFIQLLQQLGTGAVMGFAFQLAMEYLAPTIGSVLSKIEAASRFINTMGNVQPCQAGMAAGKALADVMTGKTPDLSMFENRWKAIQGAAMDLWEQSHTTGSKTPSDTASALAGDQDWDVRGNLVWDVLHHRHGVWPKDDTEQILSLIGTVIVDDKGLPTNHPPILHVRDLLEARGQEINVYRCQNEACLQMEVLPLPVTGLQVRVEQVLDNFINDLQTRSPLSAQVVTWIDYTHLPIYRLFVENQGDVTKLQHLRVILSRLIAAKMLEMYVVNLLKDVEIGVQRYTLYRSTWGGMVDSVRNRILQVATEARGVAQEEAVRINSELGVTSKVLEFANRPARRK